MPANQVFSDGAHSPRSYECFMREERNLFNQVENHAIGARRLQKLIAKKYYARLTVVAISAAVPSSEAIGKPTTF